MSKATPSEQALGDFLQCCSLFISDAGNKRGHDTGGVVDATNNASNNTAHSATEA